ncbi:hypothetical protein PAXINDRAFT_17291 [Paxillus involutus ATCC 200175]|uniref:Uncharacterized protein n=1 Tax=Paxillus involutus ATCC 200175 TaxID=664439 RepID=A0A0C9TFH3_PAXIN|nr:hypothetical protein PAXINDRAFT_17291 [Paxillus involutus ATCC 200175]
MAGQGGTIVQLEKIGKAVEHSNQPSRPQVSLPADEPVNHMAPTPRRAWKKTRRATSKSKDILCDGAETAQALPISAPVPMFEQSAPGSHFGFQVWSPAWPTYVGTQPLQEYKCDRLSHEQVAGRKPSQRVANLVSHPESQRAQDQRSLATSPYPASQHDSPQSQSHVGGLQPRQCSTSQSLTSPMLRPVGHGAVSTIHTTSRLVIPQQRAPSRTVYQDDYGSELSNLTEEEEPLRVAADKVNEMDDECNGDNEEMATVVRRLHMSDHGSDGMGMGVDQNEFGDNDNATDFRFTGEAPDGPKMRGAESPASPTILPIRVPSQQHVQRTPSLQQHAHLQQRQIPSQQQ